MLLKLAHVCSHTHRVPWAYPGAALAAQVRQSVRWLMCGQHMTHTMHCCGIWLWPKASILPLLPPCTPCIRCACTAWVSLVCCRGWFTQLCLSAALLDCYGTVTVGQHCCAVDSAVCCAQGRWNGRQYDCMLSATGCVHLAPVLHLLLCYALGCFVLPICHSHISCCLTVTSSQAGAEGS